MNEELLDLLRAAGVDRPLAWRDLVIVNNYRPLPPPANAQDARRDARGLNLLVLDRDRPTHFCKCRPTGNADLERETAARNCLAPVESSVRVLPVTSATSEQITLQVSRFLAGTHYGTLTVGQSTEQFVDTVGSILAGLGPLTDHAVAACTEVERVRAAATLDLETEAAAAVAYLAPLLGLEGDDLAALAEVFADSEYLPVRPQHCDLWWRNLIAQDGEFWLIDFEEYGDVSVPLFDDLTLLASTLTLRVGREHGGVETLCGEHAEAAACRAVLRQRAASEGLDEPQLDGILAFFALVRAATVYRRAGPEHAARHLRTARFVVDRLSRGERGLLLDPS